MAAAAGDAVLDSATKTEWRRIDGDLIVKAAARSRADATVVLAPTTAVRGEGDSATKTGCWRRIDGDLQGGGREENQKMMEAWMRVSALAARSTKARSASATGGLRAAGIGQGRAGVMETVRRAAMETGSRG
ncbi:hypothetical protein OsI_25626 [Oryza sativa Indica Group]|uniref:DUF834 domain-containing protein n=2 Tax=Oryza TaxID=4527 RepID=A0A0E0HZ39_ORYNI|nr:hypothetical protein OsI_25626 [Oryza sativa Indica Group]